MDPFSTWASFMNLSFFYYSSSLLFTFHHPLHHHSLASNHQSCSTFFSTDLFYTLSSFSPPAKTVLDEGDKEEAIHWQGRPKTAEALLVFTADCIVVMLSSLAFPGLIIFQKSMCRSWEPYSRLLQAIIDIPFFKLYIHALIPTETFWSLF